MSLSNKIHLEQNLLVNSFLKVNKKKRKTHMQQVCLQSLCGDVLGEPREPVTCDCHSLRTEAAEA